MSAIDLFSLSPFAKPDSLRGGFCSGFADNLFTRPKTRRDSPGISSKPLLRAVRLSSSSSSSRRYRFSDQISRTLSPDSVRPATRWAFSVNLYQSGCNFHSQRARVGVNISCGAKCSPFHSERGAAASQAPFLANPLAVRHAPSCLRGKTTVDKPAPTESRSSASLCPPGFQSLCAQTLSSCGGYRPVLPGFRVVRR